MGRRKERIGELYVIFYDNDKEIANKLDEIVESTGLKKREIVIKSLRQYLSMNENVLKEEISKPTILTVSKFEEELFGDLED